MRKCSRCGTELDPARVLSLCRPCAAAYARSRRREHGDAIRAYDRQRRKSRDELDRLNAYSSTQRQRALEIHNLSRCCVVCAGPMPPHARRSIEICSDVCRDARHLVYAERSRRRRGVAPSDSELATSRRSQAQRKRWETPGHLGLAAKPCRYCGESFVRSSPPQRYCSIECKHASRFAHKHGMPKAVYDRLVDDQQGLCAICGTSGRGGKGRGGTGLVVDHNHDTGAIRGLLCPDCNTALGRFRDDPILLRIAAEYAEREGWLPGR